MPYLFRIEARRVFHNIAGSPPWICAGCGYPIMKIGRRVNEGHIHHIDFDPTNNVPENLEVRHPGCHTRVHGSWSKGKRFSDEHRASISKALKGKQNSLGRKHSVETRKKISESMKGNQNRARSPN